MQPRTTFTQNADANGVQESTWIYLDAWASPVVGVQVNVYQNPGDPPVVYTVQETMDDPNDPLGAVPPAYMTWFNVNQPAMVNGTAPAQMFFNSAPRYIRLIQTAGKGIAMLTVTQALSVPL